MTESPKPQRVERSSAEIGDQFERELRSGRRPDISRFLDPSDRRSAAAMFRELLTREVAHRHERGEAPDRDDYLNRYPDFAEQVDEVFFQTLTSGAAGNSSSARALPRVFNVGETIDDFYLLRWLGEGAFAAVFLARQNSMQRHVALKISACGSHEPKTLAQLDHPNIVRVYDQREIPDQGMFLIYMEYVPAGTLQNVVRAVRHAKHPNASLLHETLDETLRLRDEPIGGARRDHLHDRTWPEIVCEIGADLAGALDYAHRKGTLHRDLKPANILLTADGHPKLVDFNIAFSELVDGASPEDHFGGSLGYMSPEQLRAVATEGERGAELAKGLDGRSDVYSLGMVLWELICGRRPFEDGAISPNYLEAARKLEEIRLAGVPATSHERLREQELPPGLAETLERCLAPERDERFASAGDLAFELKLCLQPAARNLIEPPRTGWIGLLHRHALLFTVIVALLPNLLLSVFNVIYDGQMLMPTVRGSSPAQYYGLQTPLKGILYALGVIYGVWWVWMIHLQPQSMTAARRDEARRRSLFLGDVIFGITISCWVVSGMLVPSWLAWRGAELTAVEVFHFFTAHLLCGLIAGTLAAFPGTHLVSQVYYPRLLGRRVVPPKERTLIAGLLRRQEIYVRMAMVVPFAASISLGIVGTRYSFPYIALTILAVVALIVEYRLSHSVTANFEALQSLED